MLLVGEVVRGSEGSPLAELPPGKIVPLGMCRGLNLRDCNTEKSWHYSIRTPMVGLDIRALPSGSTISSMLAWFVQQLQLAGG